MQQFKFKRILIRAIVLVLCIGALSFLSHACVYAMCCLPGSCGSQCSHVICPNGNDCCCNPNAPSGYGINCTGSSKTVTCNCCGNHETYYKCCTSGCSCTASCPSGSNTTKTNDHNCYAGQRRCTCTDECGDKHHHGDGKNCYTAEPNTAPDTSVLSLCIDGTCTTLSTNVDNPTRFALPTAGQTVTLKATATAPSGSGGLSYLYRINNWEGSGFDCAFANDYCEGFTDNDETANVRNEIGLDYGESYGVWVHTYSKDSCDEEKKEGPLAHGYFRIDRPPTVVSVTPVNLTCNSGWSGKYGETGVDNPLDVEVTISDPDIATFGINPAEEISRVFLALAPDESDNIGDAGCTAWEDGLKEYLGIVVALRIDGTVGWKAVADQTKPDEPDGVDNGCPWGASNDPSAPKFVLESVSSRADGNNLIVTFQIQFTDEFTEGEYKWFAMTNDRYGAANCNGAYCYEEFGDWGIDHTVPTLSKTVESVGSDKIEFFWEATDDYEGVCEIIAENDPLPSYLIAPSGGWFGGTYSPPVASISGTDLVTVSLNDVPEAGVDISGIRKVVTDRACNLKSLGGSSIGWGGAWLRTNGGDIFSSEGTYNYIPDGTEEFNSYPNQDKVMSRYMYLKDLGAGDNLGDADSSCSYGSPWDMITEVEGPLVEGEVQELFSKVETMVGEDGDTVTIGGKTYSVHEVSGYSGAINGLHVYYSPGDLTIDPDIKNDNAASGALFIARGDIIIGGGNDHSESSVGTDILEGLFIAGGVFKTDLDLGTEYPDYADGLRIHGAVVSLGKMSLDRNVGFTDNTDSSSERFIYDARYIDLFRPLLGGTGKVHFVESGAL